jgi:hypothetical protein
MIADSKKRSTKTVKDAQKSGFAKSTKSKKCDTTAKKRQFMRSI